MPEFVGTRAGLARVHQLPRPGVARAWHEACSTKSGRSLSTRAPPRIELRRTTMKKGTLFAAAVSVVALAASVANAQEEKKAPGFVSRPVGAPSNALEIDLATAYNQGVGNFTSRAGD